jgi:hypothetical protein
MVHPKGIRISYVTVRLHQKDTQQIVTLQSDEALKSHGFGIRVISLCDSLSESW